MYKFIVKRFLPIIIYGILSFLYNVNAQDLENLSRIVKESELESKIISSIMFTREDQTKLANLFLSIEGRIPYNPNIIAANEEKQKKERENIRSYIYLGSLMFFDEKNWAVWLNEKKINYRNNDENNELYIKYIDKNKVHVVWNLGISKWKIITGKSDSEVPPLNDKNMIVNEFNLMPNQTFILSNKTVMEGKIDIPLTVDNEISQQSSLEQTPNQNQINILTNQNSNNFGNNFNAPK